MAQTPADMYEMRERRISNAISLASADRVPFLLSTGYFPAVHQSVSIKEVMYDENKMMAAWEKTYDDLQPDMFLNPFPSRYVGAILETLDFKQLCWAGHGLPDNQTYQFIEDEYMTADEYDDLIYDPADFMLRKYWPRIFGALAPFKDFPKPRNIISYYLGLLEFARLDADKLETAFAQLVQGVRDAQKVIACAAKMDATMRAKGFPPLHGGLTQAPFDTISDFLRGTRATMLDMFRNRDKLLAAIDKIYPMMLEQGLAAKERGVPRVFIPIHKCMNDFMSQEQFEIFYWPSLKQLILELIDADLTPHLLWEGDVTSRLEQIGDIPRGKAIYHFENTDIFQAKEVLGSNVCIMGGVPVSLLCTGSKDQVRNHCRHLIDTLGKDGGYIMDASANIEDARPENVVVMAEVIRDHGNLH